MDDLSTDQILAERIHLKLERTGAHSHIQGLGLGPKLVPKDVIIFYLDIFHLCWVIF